MNLINLELSILTCGKLIFGIFFLGKEMDSKNIDKFDEIYVVSSDWSWTYMKTHEDDCGPYFYRS